MKKLTIIILLSGAPMLFFTSCGEKAQAVKAAASEIIPVKTIPITASDGGATITLSGQFTTDDEVMLGFKTGGIISRILVKEGDAVKQGQVLATLDLTEINAQVQQAQLGFEKAQRDYQRANNLYRDSVATLEQLQNSKTALDMARQQLSAAKFNQSYSEIRAPKSGYILHKMANEGQVVAPGTPVLQTNGAASGNWLLKAGVSDHEWNAITIGAHATISLPSAANSYEGTVIRKSKAIDPVTGTFSIDIRINDNTVKGLASGMFGKATIENNSASPEKTAANWYIPYDALLDGNGATGYVFATNDGKTAQKVLVTIGGMDKNGIIITDGLQHVQQLIISGSAYLTDRSPIRIIP